MVESGSRLPSIKILFCSCIKRGADALANLPNLGKVDPAIAREGFSKSLVADIFLNPNSIAMRATALTPVCASRCKQNAEEQNGIQV